MKVWFDRVEFIPMYQPNMLQVQYLAPGEQRFSITIHHIATDEDREQGSAITGVDLENLVKMIASCERKPLADIRAGLEVKLIRMPTWAEMNDLEDPVRISA